MIFVFVAALLAQQPEADRLVEALGSDSPAERERASAALERLGEDAEKALRAGVASGNPEIAGRSSDLLRKLRALELSTLRLERVDCPFGAFGRADRLAVTPDGKHAVGCDLQDVKVWELPSGRCVAVWRPHEEAGRDIALAPDGKRVLTWGYRGSALWELPSGRLVRRFDSDRVAPRVAVASPDGRSLGWADGTVVEWVDAGTGRRLWSRKQDIGNAMNLAVRPDGRRIAVVGANHRTIEVLDARSGTLIFGFDAPTTGSYSKIGWTRDGAGIVVTNPDHRNAWLFSGASGDRLREAEEFEAPALLGSKARVRVTHPRDEKETPGWTVVRHKGLSGFNDAENWFLADEDRLVVVRAMNDRKAVLYDAGTGERRGELGADLASVAPAADGVLAGTRKGELLWIGFDGAERARVAGGEGEVEFVASAGPGRALWRDGAGVLRCSELATGRELWRRESFPYGPFGQAIAPDGLHAAAHRPDPGGGSRQMLVRYELATGKEKGAYGSFDGYLAGVAFSPDGALLAASSRDGPLAVWETESRKRLWERKPGKDARWLRFSADSTSLFAGDDEGRILRLGSRDGAEQRVYAAAGPAVRDGALSPDGKTLAVLAGTGDLLLYDAVDGSLRSKSDGHGTGGVSFVGADLLVGLFPRAVDPVTGAPRSAVSGARLQSASCDPERRRLGALHTDRRFVVVDLAVGKPLWQAQAPEGALLVVLGAKAEFAVFYGETDWGMRVIRPGADAPSATLNGAKFLGADAGKGALYTRQEGRLQRRDLATLALRHEIEDPGVKYIAPCGAARWVLARLEDGAARLDAESFAPIGRLPLLEDAEISGADASGELLIASDGFRDGLSGALRAPFPHAEMEYLVGRFLDADGRRLRLVGEDGKLLTYGPRP